MEQVSAIIPHYGPVDGTRLLLGVLLRSDYPSLEIIIADDCSPEPFPDGEGYTVIRREVNGGFGSNVSTGATAASGKYLLVLNSDLAITESFVSELMSAAEPVQPAVCSPKVVEGEGPSYVARKWPKARHHSWEWLTPFARIRHTKFWHWMVGHDINAHESDRPARTDWVVGACMLIPREAFEEVGGFDQRFFMNSEEVDLQRRLTDHGVPSVYLPSVSVGHASGGSSPSEKRIQWVLNSRFIYARKWGGAKRLRVAMAAAAGINFLWNLTKHLRKIEGVEALGTFRKELRQIKTAWDNSKNPKRG